MVCYLQAIRRWRVRRRKVLPIERWQESEEYRTRHGAGSAVGTSADDAHPERYCVYFCRQQLGCTEPCPGGTVIAEISHNEVATTRPEVALRKAAKDAELMPPPSRPASRAGRTGTVRRAARTISEETAESKGQLQIASDEAGLRIPKTRQANPVTSAAALLRDLNLSSSSSARSARSQQTSESEAEKPKRTATVNKRSADASLARRPRAPSRTIRQPERPLSPQDEVPGPLATLDELKKVSPIKRARKKAAEAEVIEILSDPEDVDELAPAAPALSLPPPPSMSSKRLPVPRKPSRPIMPDCVSGTDPETVLSRLTTFRDNLSAALSNTLPPSSAPAAESGRLPFVSRWVDYSRKHGVGYVLSDGTVGCIINASSKNGGTPVTHVFVRNGQRWLSKVGKSMEGLESISMEILEDCHTEGIKRKIYKGLGSVREGSIQKEEERRRTLGVLWVKFGRYMCQSLDGEETDASRSDGNFVRFYQRIGNVGIWAFADGCLQVSLRPHNPHISRIG
jgi:hypothetical protein